MNQCAWCKYSNPKIITTYFNSFWECTILIYRCVNPECSHEWEETE